MTPKQLEIVQHALGADKYGKGKRYRNHFCAGGNDVEDCRVLVNLGYAETFERSYLPYFNITITDAGIAAMLRESPQPPKLTRSQKRYRQFLDADCGMRFGDSSNTMPENLAASKCSSIS